MKPVSSEVELYIALGSLLLGAVLVVYLGGRRLLQRTIETKRTQSNFNQVMSTMDAMALPLVGSMSLFTIYVLLRFIPLEYINALISFYLSVVGVFCLGGFIRSYAHPNILTGVSCCAVGCLYYCTNNWVANNVLAVSIGVSSIESIHLGSFKSSFVLLIGLFLYDIFWVFGSDVMLTVASGVNGPIKIVFPRTIFGDHELKSLLGLGDLIIPGFFIAQTLVFSFIHVKRGSFYFHVALVAYTLSLVNTMAVMLIFEHGQPALLFIVPWLLITFLVAAVSKGDLRAALLYSSDDVTGSCSASSEADETEAACEGKGDGDGDGDDEGSLLALFWKETRRLFGLESSSWSTDGAQGEAKKKE